jgi:hypothetical protein
MILHGLGGDAYAHAYGYLFCLSFCSPPYCYDKGCIVNAI